MLNRRKTRNKNKKKTNEQSKPKQYKKSIKQTETLPVYLTFS